MICLYQSMPTLCPRDVSTAEIMLHGTYTVCTVLGLHSAKSQVHFTIGPCAACCVYLMDSSGWSNSIRISGVPHCSRAYPLVDISYLSTRSICSMWLFPPPSLELLNAEPTRTQRWATFDLFELSTESHSYPSPTLYGRRAFVHATVKNVTFLLLSWKRRNITSIWRWKSLLPKITRSGL